MTTKQLFIHLCKLVKVYQNRGTSYCYDVALTESSLRKNQVVGHYDVVKMANVAWAYWSKFV